MSILPKERHTKTNIHTLFPPHSKTNIFSLHYTCKLYLSPHPPFFCASASFSTVFFPLCSLYTIFVSIYNVQLSLAPSPPLSEQPSQWLLPFHNSWSCSYGSGSHVGCESLRLKGSLSLHHLSQEGYRMSYCAQVSYRTKSTCSVTPETSSTCKLSAFV